MIIKAFAAGAGVSAAILGVVFATGATFGQRCGKAFPDDLAARELCVYEMSKGIRPYPTAKAPPPSLPAESDTSR